MDIVFTHHSSASNPFWQAVKRGFDDACEKIGATCQMIFTQTEGAIDQQAANMMAALAGQPDALLTSIVDNNAFDQIISSARESGVKRGQAVTLGFLGSRRCKRGQAVTLGSLGSGRRSMI